MNVAKTLRPFVTRGRTAIEGFGKGVHTSVGSTTITAAAAATAVPTVRVAGVHNNSATSKNCAKNGRV